MKYVVIVVGGMLNWFCEVYRVEEKVVMELTQSAYEMRSLDAPRMVRSVR
jgi:hypothetical protein